MGQAALKNAIQLVASGIPNRFCQNTSLKAFEKTKELYHKRKEPIQRNHS